MLPSAVIRRDSVCRIERADAEWQCTALVHTQGQLENYMNNEIVLLMRGVTADAVAPPPMGNLQRLSTISARQPSESVAAVRKRGSVAA